MGLKPAEDCMGHWISTLYFLSAHQVLAIKLFLYKVHCGNVSVCVSVLIGACECVYQSGFTHLLLHLGHLADKFIQATYNKLICQKKVKHYIIHIKLVCTLMFREQCCHVFNVQVLQCRHARVCVHACVRACVVIPLFSM